MNSQLAQKGISFIKTTTQASCELEIRLAGDSADCSAFVNMGVPTQSHLHFFFLFKRVGFVNRYVLFRYVGIHDSVTATIKTCQLVNGGVTSKTYVC